MFRRHQGWEAFTKNEKRKVAVPIDSWGVFCLRFGGVSEAGKVERRTTYDVRLRFVGAVCREGSVRATACHVGGE